MMSLVSFESIGNVGVIRLNNPPVNALPHAARKSIHDKISEAREHPVQVLLIVGAGKAFCAGTDIAEFSEPPKSPILPEVCSAIENSVKPVIAAIHGAAVGGGVELALACHYRCASNSARMSTPEVKLGLIPGSGGTQRVPRLIGVKGALDLMTSGRFISAARAKEIGLIDRVLGEADFFEEALAFAREVAETGRPVKKIRDMSIDPAVVEPHIFDDYRNMMHKRARGQDAPLRVISCVEAAVNLPFEEGLKKERELFRECRRSSQSAAMRHLFFAEREAGRIKGVEGLEPRSVSSAAIVGCGTMGSGLAVVFANAGIPVKILVRSEEALERGMGKIRGNYALSVKKGKLTEVQVGRNLALIEFTRDYGVLSEADLVIEAVYEDLELKKQVFSRLDQVCRDGAILATNTSYQSVSSIASATGRPGDVLGLHFFAPANVMKLLEIVRTGKTSDEVIFSALCFAKSIGKIPVLAGDSYGFIGNRMYRRYVRETQFCLIEGAVPEQVDRAMEEWGMAMGPLAVGDLTGLDIGYKARQALSAEEKGDPRGYCVNDTLAEMGRLGRKSGRGYYLYDPDVRGRTPNPEVMDVIRKQAAQYGIKQREFTDDEIVERFILSLVNEGSGILEDGIAMRPGDIDVVYCNGYGFPRFRGGPMFYADSLGLETVNDTMKRLRDKTGDLNWNLPPLLEKLAAEGRGFSGWTRG